MLLLEDFRIRQATSSNLSQILNRSYWWPYTDSNLYRPVTTLSYLLNYSTLGNEANAFGYHALNLTIHIVNVLLLYLVSLRLSGRFRAAVAVAALWGVHPLSTEAVTNLVGRADLLCALGVFGALFAYIRAAETRTDRTASRHQRWLLLSLVMATVAIFSKESGVAVIAVIALYDLVYQRNLSITSRARRWSLFAIPVVLFLIQRSRVIPAGLPSDPFVDNPIVGAGFWAGRLTALSVVGRYLRLVIWPRTLSSDYSYAQIPIATGSPADWASWIVALTLVVLTITLLVRAVTDRTATAPALEEKRALRDVGFALACASAIFLPVSNLLFPTGTIMAERVMYLPTAGLVVGLVAAAFWTGKAIRLPLLGPVLLALAVVLAGGRTLARNPDWRDEVTLWQSAVRAAPKSFKTHQGLADALYESDPTHIQLDRIVAEAEQSVAILDQLPDALKVPATYRRAAGFHLERGDALRESKASDAPAASRAAYQRSIALTEQYLKIVEVGRSNAPARGSVPTSAAGQRDSTWELSEAYVMLATGHARLRDFEHALEAAQRARTLQPLNSIPYRVLATALIDSERYDEAARWLLSGFMVTGDGELRQATIDLYRGAGDPKGCAIKETEDGPTLNPACEPVRQQLCAATEEAIRIQSQTGRRDLAEQLAESAATNYGCKPM